MSYMPANKIVTTKQMIKQLADKLMIWDQRIQGKKEQKIRKKNLNQYVFDSVKLGLIPVMFLGFQIQPLK